METNSGCFNQRLVFSESSFIDSEVSNGVKKEVVAKKGDIEYFNEGVIDQCTEPEDNIPVEEYNSNGILVEMVETRCPETEVDKNSQALKGEVLDSVDLIKTEEESEKTVEYFEEGTTEQSTESGDDTLMAQSNPRGIIENGVKGNCHYSKGNAVDTVHSIETKENDSLHTGQFRMHPDLTILKEEINGGYIPERDVCGEFYTCHEKSDIEMVYKCSTCTFSTTCKHSIENHSLLHMKSVTIQTEKVKKCSFPGCNFQTIHDVKKHEKRHSNVFNKCNICSFLTKDKTYLSSHVTRVHGKSLGMEIFRCDDCSYEATLQANLIQHQEVHKKRENRKILKCPVAACSYEAICRRTLKRHSLQHIDPSQVKILKCTKCPYYTIEKEVLRKHTKRVHGNTQSEKEVFRCDKCRFRTHHKPSLKGHVLIHTNRVEMFKCPHCSYESKRKGNLTQHLVKHKSSSEVEMFKCALCSFETKRKHCLRSHIVTHINFKNRR